MAKIIKLTEADLNKLIQKVLQETVAQEAIVDKTTKKKKNNNV